MFPQHVVVVDLGLNQLGVVVISVLSVVLLVVVDLFDAVFAFQDHEIAVDWDLFFDLHLEGGVQDLLDDVPGLGVFVENRAELILSNNLHFF